MNLDRNTGKRASDETEAPIDNRDVRQDEKELSSGYLRPQYGLFILPVFIILIGLLFGYLKNCTFKRVRNLIRMVENYMLSVDQDIEETPVKVLERLNSLSTWDGS